MISLTAIICLYLMVNVSYLTLLTPLEMINSKVNKIRFLIWGCHLIAFFFFYIGCCISKLKYLYGNKKENLKHFFIQTWAEKAIGNYAIVILLGVFVSVLGSCFGVMLSNTR